MSKWIDNTIEFITSSGLYKGFYDLAVKLTILAVAFIAPLKGMLITLFILIIIDLLTGLLASFKKKQKITSAKLSRTITKTAIYFFTVFLVKGASEHVILNDDIPLTTMVGSFIILTELQSILENLNKLTKQNFLQVLIDKISLVTKGRTTTITRRGRR